MDEPTKVSEFSILSLPTEALLCITSFLKCKDILIIGEVCKYLLSISRHERLWRRRIVRESEISERTSRNGYLLDFASEQDKDDNDSVWWRLYQRASSVYNFGEPPTSRVLTFSDNRRVTQSRFNIFDNEDSSIEMWIKPNLNKPDGVILGCQSSTFRGSNWPHYHWQICHIGPDGCVRGGILPYALLLGPRVDDGHWHHIALTSCHSMQCLYVDGHLVDKAERDFDSEAERRYMDYLQLGTGCISYGPSTPYAELAKPRNFQGYYSYHGHIYDLRFWKKCLSVTEIEERKCIQRIDVYLEKYNHNELSNLSLYWPLNKMVNGSWPWQASVCGKATLNSTQSQEDSSVFQFVPIE